MKLSTQDRIDGHIHEVKGKIKEKVGRAIGDPDLETEGGAETLGGKIQKKLGQVERVFEK